MSASSSTGFASEVIGREATFLDHLLSIFGHVPVVSQLAAGLVHFLGLDKDAADLVPKLSFVICAFIIGISPFVIKAMLHLWLVMTRTFTKGTGANARWATLFEIFQNYSMPTKFSNNLFAYWSALIVVITFGISFNIHFSLLVVILCSIPVGYGIRLMLGSYEDLKNEIMPYPIGTYMMFNIYLTGGLRTSFIRGKVSEQRQGHLVVIAPSGAGKTTTYFIPGLLEDATNFCSAIVVEAKASKQEDMFSKIAPTWIKAGKKIMLFDPWDGKGQSFNPLMNLNPSFTDPETRDIIENIVDAIYRTYELERGSASGDAAFYADQEKGVMKGLLTIALFKPLEERNLAAVAKVANQTLEDVIGYIKTTIGAVGTPDSLSTDVYDNLNWFLHEDNLQKTQRASTLRGVAGKLAIFTHPRVMPHVVNDELDLDLVFKEPTLFCIKAPLNVPGASTMASILIRLLMSKVPNKLGIYAEEAIKTLEKANSELTEAQNEGKTPVISDKKAKVAAAEATLEKVKATSERFKVFFYLDELPALSLPKFAEFCKTARSSGTGILAAIQDRADLADVIRAKLGLSSIDGLLGNFKTQILLPGLAPATSEHYSKSFGRCEIKSRRTTRSTTNAVDFSYFTAREEKQLIQPDSIQHMKTDLCIIADMNLRPFFAKKVPYYKNKKYIRLIKKNKDVPIVLFKKEGKHLEFAAPSIPKYGETIDDEKIMKAIKKKRDEIIDIPTMTTSRGNTVVAFTADAETDKSHNPVENVDNNSVISDIASNDRPEGMSGPGHVHPF